ARGHGRSTPAKDPNAYGYPQLASDLETVLDALELPRATLAGASMGAHTALRFGLENPERVSALAVITPAYDPSAPEGEHDARREGLAGGVREGGAEGFLAAYDFSGVPEPWRETVRTAVLQRLSAHDHPAAVADAMEALAGSRPFDALSELGAIRVPTLVVAS